MAEIRNSLITHGKSSHFYLENRQNGKSSHFYLENRQNRWKKKKMKETSRNCTTPSVTMKY